MKLGTTKKDEIDKEALVTWFSVSLVMGWIGGYVSTDALKELGYTYRITAEVTGGGGSTTIHPIAAEWFGGIVAATVFGLAFLTLVLWRSRKMSDAEDSNE